MGELGLIPRTSISKYGAFPIAQWNHPSSKAQSRSAHSHGIHQRGRERREVWAEYDPGIPWKDLLYLTIAGHPSLGAGQTHALGFYNGFPLWLGVFHYFSKETEAWD